MPSVTQGYFGSVVISGDNISDPENIRANSVDLKVTQTIDKPPLIDNRFDYTLYQLGGIEVGGSIAFPVALDQTATLIEPLWEGAMLRSDLDGRMQNDYDVDVRYAGPVAHHAGNATGSDVMAGGSNDDVAFRYTGNKINTFEFSVAQGDVINISADFIGIERQPLSGVQDPQYQFRNARIATWNDVVLGIALAVGDENEVYDGSVLTDFSVTVNNNITRFYSFNRKLTPVDISATKRDISGNLSAYGRLKAIADGAFENECDCFADGGVIFGFNPQLAECPSTFGVYLPGVVFEIEEISLSTDVFKTTMNWHSLPGSFQSGGFSGSGQDPASVAPDERTFIVPNFPDFVLSQSLGPCGS